MLKEFTFLNGDCDLFSQAVLCASQQQKKLGMQPCMNLGLSLETCATLRLVPRQSQVEFVLLRKYGQSQNSAGEVGRAIWVGKRSENTTYGLRMAHRVLPIPPAEFWD